MTMNDAPKTRLGSAARYERFAAMNAKLAMNERSEERGQRRREAATASAAS